MNNKIKFILDKSSKDNKKCVIFLPGVSGKVFEDDLYSKTVNELLNKGFSTVRFQVWKSSEELQKLNIEKISKVVRNSIKFAKSKGYKDIGGIGKSFGGGILLEKPIKEIKCLVLWAPAVNFGEKSNITKINKTELSKISGYMGIKLNKNNISKIKSKTLLIHGTNDERISFKNSENIAKNLPNGHIMIIKDADHSFKSTEARKKLINGTISFFINNLVSAKNSRY